jgi:hypothetical protein
MRLGRKKPGEGARAGSFDDFYAAEFQRLSLQLYAYTADVGLAQDAVQPGMAYPEPDGKAADNVIERQVVTG